MSERKVKISAVRYANTYPFLFGLAESGFYELADISTDHPADCAKKLITNKVDIGLVPVASLPKIKDYRIITDYCLGAYGKVETVLLLSNSPFEELTTICLDYRSLSSITLVKILAKNAWKREFTWKKTDDSFDFSRLDNQKGVVLIGDQCIEFSERYKHKIDLAEEWTRFSGLPFAFACWAANKPIDPNFLEQFNNALAIGVNNIPAVVERYGGDGIIRGDKLYRYLTENINFKLDENKKKAIKLFLDYTKQI